MASGCSSTTQFGATVATFAAKASVTTASCPAGGGAVGTTTTTTAGPTLVQGAMTLSGISDTTAFVNNPASKTAVAAGIATTAGVNASLVSVTLTPTSRRLEAVMETMRRLTPGVNVSYTITIPSSMSSTVTSASSALQAANVTTIANNIQAKVLAANIAGATIAVSAVSVAVIAPTTVTTTKAVSASSVLAPHFAVIVGLALAALVRVGSF